jgi:hypothetical protein
MQRIPFDVAGADTREVLPRLFKVIRCLRKAPKLLAEFAKVIERYPVQGRMAAHQIDIQQQVVPRRLRALQLVVGVRQREDGLRLPRVIFGLPPGHECLLDVRKSLAVPDPHEGLPEVLQRPALS